MQSIVRACPPRDALATVRTHIRELFATAREGDVHGYAHAMAVYEHARAALREDVRRRPLHTDRQMAVLYAALLHDADDPKVFPASDASLPNARRILSTVQFNLVELVVEMISLVSFSKNANSGAILELDDSHGPNARVNARPRWMFIPRDADRLEALGAIGVARCVAYGAQIGRPLSVPSTPMPTDRRALYALAARWHLERKPCRSTMEYFIAGLIPRAVMASRTAYTARLAADRMRIIERVCLHPGAIDMHALVAIIGEENPAAVPLMLNHHSS